jgi:small subunit ribosomal protein S6
MRHYEVTFIVDPILSSDEVKATAQKYVDMITGDGYEITYVNEMGLLQLAYPIKKRQSGVYYCIEFAGANGNVVDKYELAMRRDETLMRFLTVALDNAGVQYNADKRAGKIGSRKKAEVALTEEIAEEVAAEAVAPQA